MAGPIVMFTSFPQKDVTLHDNWGGVVGLRGTGSVDFSIENYQVPKEMTFIWDLLQPKPLRGGPSYLLPPFSFVAKEHGSVAIGAARRSLDELITLATTTRGQFRSSKLDERQVVHRFIGEADLKLNAARALLHQSYERLYEGASAGKIPAAPTSPKCVRPRSMPLTSRSRRQRRRFISRAIAGSIIRT